MENDEASSFNTSSSTTDVLWLDRLCEACFSAEEATRRTAEEELLAFQRRPDAWTTMPAILAETKVPATRFFAAQTLEKQVDFAWGGLDLEERTGVRSFVLAAIEDAASPDSPLRSDRAYLLKLDNILLKMVMLDWLHGWPDFLDVFLSSAQSTPTHCENALVVLRMLAEELDYEGRRVSRSKLGVLERQLSAEVYKVFPLIGAALQPVDQLQPGQDLHLVPAALSLFTALYPISPSPGLLSSSIPDQLIQCLRFPELQPQAMTAVGAILASAEGDDAQISGFAFAVLETLEACSPSPSEDESSYDGWRERAGESIALPFAQLLANILVIPVTQDRATTRMRQLSTYAMELLVEIAVREDEHVVEICFDYWLSNNSLVPDPSVLGGLAAENACTSGIRRVLVEIMPPPTQVISVLNDEGELVREEMKETSFISVREKMLRALQVLCEQDHLHHKRELLNYAQRAVAKWVKGNPNPDDPSFDAFPEFLQAFLPMASKVALPTGSASSDSGYTELFKTVVHTLQEQLTTHNDEEQQLQFVRLIRRTAGLAPQPDTLLFALDCVFEVLETAEGRSYDLVNEAADAFYEICRACGPALTEGQPSHLVTFLRDRWPEFRDVSTVVVEISCKVYAAIGAALRHVKSPDEREQLTRSMVDPLLEEISSLSRYAQQPQHLSDPTFQDDLLPPLRNLASFALSLRSSFLTTLKLLSPWLKRLYGGASTFLADTAAQEGLAALSSSPARSARLIRKRVNVLVQSAAYSLAQDTLANGSPLYLPSSSPSTTASTTQALTFFTKTFLPAWLSLVMPDFERSPIEAVDLSLLEFCQDVLVYLGAHTDPPVLLSLLMPGIAFMLRNTRSDGFDRFPELRDVSFVIYGYAISHQALRLEQHSPEAQDELAELSLYGMRVVDRSVAENSLSAAYHLLNTASPSRISLMSTTEASGAFSFFRRHSLSFITAVWSLINDTSHAHVYEMQASLISRVWEIASSYEERVFPDGAYQAEENNIGLLRRWLVEMLLQAFPLLQSDVEACYAIFDDLWQLPRVDLVDETAFGERLRDYLLDLQPYRGVERIGM